ncbi:MAG TPA: hypothetical protein VGO22_17320 [Pseudorhizobium sp.]|jgi:hypothetical protein|nr:hypothetical protein [Pseudorhizobium sp.]
MKELRSDIRIMPAGSILEAKGPELVDRRFNGTVGDLSEVGRVNEDDRLSEDLLGSAVGYCADQIPDRCAFLLVGKVAHAATSLASTKR